MYEDFVQQYEDSDLAPKSFYRIGEILLKQKKYLMAVEVFRDVVTRFPEHELAAQAQYQVGCIFSEIGEDSVALKALRKVVEDYPDSPQAPKAQLKVSDILSERMHDRRSALAELKNLQTVYGESSEAETASGMEKTIGREVAEEDSDDYQRERYGAPLPDHTRGWQDEREEALAREMYAQGLDVQNYDITAQIIPEKLRMEATTRFVFITGATPEREFRFRFGSQLEIEAVTSFKFETKKHSATSTGETQEVIFKHEDNLLAVRFKEEVPGGSSIGLELKYSGDFTNKGAWRGDLIDSASGFLRPESRWYPYTNWGDNATAKVTWKVPEGLVAVGNGKLERDWTESGLHNFQWNMDQPFFGLTMAYGKYEKVEREATLADGKTLPIIFYTFADHREKAAEALEVAQSVLQFYSERFCPFPYPNLKLVEVPGFPGGYGSCTLVMLHPSGFTDGVEHWFVAHELSHQWWGNLIGVSFAEGSIPWLTEGFATYSDILYHEATQPRDSLQRHIKKYAWLYYDMASYDTDESLQTVRWSSPMYQAITYQKGSLVLHVLRYVMGDEAFFAALHEYATRYAFKRATVDDFRRMCEEYYKPEEDSPGYPETESDTPSLEWFFDQWLDRPGFPIIRVDSVKMTPKGTLYNLKFVVLQDEYVYNLPLDIQINGARESLQKRIWIEYPDTEVTLPDLPWLPQEIVLDPEGWILKDPKPSFTHWKLGKN